MRIIVFVFLTSLLLITACQRRLNAAETKQNLEKAMATYLQNQQRPGAPPLKFDMIDVTYFEDDDNTYICDFKVKLYRPDGTDTTGIIRSRVSKDFSKVSRR